MWPAAAGAATLAGNGVHLIDEDDHDRRDALCHFLRREGDQADCVADGRDALAAVLARICDVIILDMCVQRMDGGRLPEVLRSYLRLQSPPVVVPAGLPDSPLVERARFFRVNSILVRGKVTFEDILRGRQQEWPRASK